MKPALVITLFLLLNGHSFGQTGEKSLPESSTTTSATDPKFEQYCLEHAAKVIGVPQGKAINLKISGEVTTPNVANPTYRDYGVTLKENETQYFTIAGTDKLLAVSSVFRLRTGYNTEKQ